jgi:hypothetical protein
MSVVRCVGAAVLLMCTTATLSQESASDDFHPTDDQVKAMEQSCAVSDTGILAFRQKVTAAIADWKKATVETGPGTALRQLDGFFDQVRNHGALTGLKSIYVLCVEKAVRQYVDLRREGPQAVADSGSSTPLNRASFASDDDIWRSGCKQAESDAVSKLKSRCGDRKFVVVTSDCAQLTGPVRTYAAQVQGECRIK